MEQFEEESQGSLFGSLAGAGATIYGYMKAEEFARASKIVEQGQVTAKALGKNVDEVVGQVYTHLNLPFSGKLDGKFGKTQSMISNNVFSFSRSIKETNAVSMTSHNIVESFKHSNKDMLEIFKTAGASDDEIEVISKVISKKGNTSKLRKFFGEKNAFSGNMDDAVKTILKEKGLDSADDVAKNFSKVLQKYGGKLKGSAHLAGKAGIGLSINLTALSKSAPVLFKSLGLASRVFTGVGALTFAFDAVKAAGDIAIHTNKKSNKYRTMQEQKALIEGNMDYAQASSHNDIVMSRRTEGSYKASVERSVLRQALSAGSQVNELMKSALGGYNSNFSTKYRNY